MENLSRRSTQRDWYLGQDDNPFTLPKSKLWWCTTVISALRKQRQGNSKFDISLCYIVRACFKK
jgi:hypothetical protein